MHNSFEAKVDTDSTDALPWRSTQLSGQTTSLVKTAIPLSSLQASYAVPYRLAPRDMKKSPLGLTLLPQATALAALLPAVVYG